MGIFQLNETTLPVYTNYLAWITIKAYLIFLKKTWTLCWNLRLILLPYLYLNR